MSTLVKMPFRTTSFIVLTTIAFCSARLLPLSHGVIKYELSTARVPPEEEKENRLPSSKSVEIFSSDDDDYEDVMEGLIPDKKDYPSIEENEINRNGEPKDNFPVDDADSNDGDEKEIDIEHPPPEEEFDKNSAEDSGEEHKEESESKNEDGYKSHPIRGGILLNTPFFNLELITRYIKQIEKALEKAFRQTAEEAAYSNTSFVDSKEEEVDVNGKKYMIHKSIVEAGNNESSIFIEAIETEPKRIKRSNWFSQKTQKAERTDP